MKTWLITGCSSGIGRGTAEAALRNGDRVAATARDPAKLEELAKEYPETCLTLHLDLTDRKSMVAAVETVRERFGPIDVLVNNAGYGYRGAVEESEDDAVRKMFETNFFGPAELMDLCLPEMRQRRSGTIVNVSSIGAVRSAVGNGFYSASKAALELISDALLKETKDLGVKVMIVEPGSFRTGFYDSLEGTGKKIRDYDGSTGKMRLENSVNLRDQPGDPARAGRIIAEIVDGGNVPERLPLGSDAVKVIRAELENRLREVDELEDVSIRSDFP